MHRRGEAPREGGVLHYVSRRGGFVVIDQQKLLDKLVGMAFHMAVMALQRNKCIPTAFLTVL